MSVGKIPESHTHVTGRHAAQKSEGDANFESPLEAEQLLVLAHDLQVKAYDVQSVNIPVPGVARGYVPEVGNIDWGVLRFKEGVDKEWLS